MMMMMMMMQAWYKRIQTAGQKRSGLPRQGPVKPGGAGQRSLPPRRSKEAAGVGQTPTDWMACAAAAGATHGWQPVG